MPRHAPSCHATCRRPRRSAAPYTMQRAQPAYRSPCGPDGLVRREQRVRSELGCARIACRAEQSRAEWSGAGTQVLLLAAVHGSGRRRAHARLRVSDPAGRQPTASPHPPARQSTLNRTPPDVPVLCTLLPPAHTHTHTPPLPPTSPCVVLRLRVHTALPGAVQAARPPTLAVVGRVESAWRISTGRHLSAATVGSRNGAHSRRHRRLASGARRRSRGAGC
jgi:hypothetical protein